MSKTLPVGEYLLDQLYKHGVRHIFGVPGDYVLGFYRMIEASPIQHVGTTREDAAGFAADGYARVNGLGAMCVTYCVGGLSAVNPVAGAYAEKSPVVVISGAPDMKLRQRHPLLHHVVRDFHTQLDVYRQVTVASAALEDTLTAYHEIDRVLHAVERYKRPGYIELPRDIVGVAHPHQHRDTSLEEMTDAAALAECIAEATAMLNRAERPVILADVEVQRFGLQDALVELAEKTNIPVATTILGKSVMSEGHRLSLGVYGGAIGRPATRKVVESADCLLMLGCFLTDINLGVFTAHLEPGRTIYATSEKTTIRHHGFENIPFRAFFAALLQAKLRRRRAPQMPPPPPVACTECRNSARLRASTVFRVVSEFITDDTMVVTDVGDCLFGALELQTHRQTEFISPAYYSSMGFGVPAALGAQMAARRLRPLVLVGDGGFQMTGMELSTMVGEGLNPIVIVLNNRGYTTERQIMDGPFNDIHGWDFTKVVDVIGGGMSFKARTAGELRAALRTGREKQDELCLIEVELDPYDMSPALKRLGTELGKRARGQGA